MNNKGSILVLLIIVMAIIIVLGASVLNMAVMQYNIKKFNTQAKQSFYMAETGLNVAFVDAYELMDDAVEDSLKKANEYLLLFPLNEVEAENIFRESYKIYMTTNLEKTVYRNSNPMVEITNGATLLFCSDKLKVNIKSKYNSECIEKTACVDIIILIPDYYDLKNNLADLLNYISFNGWS
ncbi:MAG: hypothetical protein ACERLG_08010 [Sedimentibacter sp.]